MRTGSHDDVSFVAITNCGESLPADVVSSLLEPFQRATSRLGNTDGAGLGLAIVAAITQMHHGAITVQGISGGGLEVHVELPRSHGLEINR